METDKKSAETVGTPAPPCAMVIFGASGDLTKRKLIPSLHYLAKNNFLSQTSAVVGVGLPAMTNEEFRQTMGSDLQEFATSSVDPARWELAQNRFSYVSGEFLDPKTYQNLKKQLAQVDKEHGTKGNYLVPPVSATHQYFLKITYTIFQ